MAAAIGQGVSLRGIYNEATQFTFKLAASITRADVGKIVALDTSAANTVKLAGDNDVPLGVLHSVEIRIQEGINVGTVGTKDSVAIPTTGVVAVGDSVTGSGTPGVAKKATTANTKTLVVEVSAGQAVVMFM